MGDESSFLNLLTDKIISLTDDHKASLPGLFAEMSRGTWITFPALRPHQRPALHMFCVQLAALALWHGNTETPPQGEDVWRTLLRNLTPGFPDDEPWCLVVEDRAKPAFLQPPDPGGLKWSPVSTPDALDMLITARNHDLKQEVMQQASPEDWLFALVSLQTMEGFGGAGNYGVARMNGGSSSRVMLGLAPGSGKNAAPDVANWWQRDLRMLMLDRADGSEPGPCTSGGTTLIWALPWPEGTQLVPKDLDPWFIEICRRVRLKRSGHRLCAERSTSKASRIEAKAFKGALADPWAPVHQTDGKSLTLGEAGRFFYKTLCELTISGNWQRPLCARGGHWEHGEMLLIAEAFSRGNSKTGGFASRVIPIPGGMVERFGAPEMKALAEAQIEEIAQADKALRNGLALLAANGDWEEVKKEHYALTREARRAFDTRADMLFFPALWERVAANKQSHAALEAAQNRFKAQLARAALAEFDAALPAIPCATIFRPRAETRARRAFFSSLKKAGFELNHQEGQVLEHS